MIYTLKNVIFYYNKLKVLDINDLCFKKGKISVISGANGCGKTTLLKILNGLLKVKSGNIYFKNKSAETDNFKQIRENSVYVHQTPFLLTGTVYDNVAYGLKIRKKGRELINKTVMQTLNLVGLSGFETRKSSDLSDGEKKRVAIARALALCPEVLLLDEPTANIDRESVGKIYKTLKEINQNTTIILSSHDSRFNESIADEIFYMENKSIISQQIMNLHEAAFDKVLF